MPNFAPITTGSDGSGQKKIFLQMVEIFYKRSDYKRQRRKSRDWPQHWHGSPECRGSRGEERTVGVTDRLCVGA